METPWSPSLLHLHEAYCNRAAAFAWWLSQQISIRYSFLCVLRMHYGHSMVTISTTFAWGLLQQSCCVCMMAIATDLHQIQLPMCVAHALWTLHGHHLYYICMRPIATDLLRLHDGYRNRSPSDTVSYVCCACIMDTPWSPSLLHLHEAYCNRSPSDAAIPSFLCMLRMHYGHSMVTTISTTFAWRLSQQISIRCSYSILPMYVAHALWTLHGHHHLYYICMRPLATDLHQMQLFHPSYVCCACIMDAPWSPSLLRLHEGYRNRSSSDTAIPSFLCMLRMHYGHSMVTISTTFAWGYRNRSPSNTIIPCYLCLLRLHYGCSMLATSATLALWIFHASYVCYICMMDTPLELHKRCHQIQLLR